MIEDLTINNDVASEPAALDYGTMSYEPEIDYNFGNKDFGYPRTLEEMNEALDRADEERKDPSKWVTAVAFHSRLEEKYPWLR
jgi:hypothetical protein